MDPPVPHARTHARTDRHIVLTRVGYVSGLHLLVLVLIVTCIFVVGKVWCYWSVGRSHVVVLSVLLLED